MVEGGNVRKECVRGKCPDPNISQASVAVHVRSGGMFDDQFITRLKILETLNIWWCYGQEYQRMAFEVKH